jgi:hypothetical protein
VGKELPRELEELSTLRAIEKEKVLVERAAAEGRLRQSGIRAWNLCVFLFVQVAGRRRRFHHAAQKREAVT